MLMPAIAAEKQNHDLLITATFQEIVTQDTNCASKMSGKLAGYGESSTFGRIAFLSQDCFSSDGGSFSFTNGKLKIMDATGDIILATYSGKVIPIINSSHGMLESATFQIYGGTGRFKNSIGSGQISGEEDLVTGMGTIKLEGKIKIKR